MKTTFTIFILIFLFPLLLLSQEQNDKINKTYFGLYPKKQTERELISILKLNVRGISLITLVELKNELDTNYKEVNFTLDSTKVYLKSGTSWFLEGLPPKKPIFFFWKFFLMQKNIDVKKRIDYCEFIATYENQGEIPYHLIEKIELKAEVIKSNDKKYLVIFEMTPDSKSNYKYSVEKKEWIELTKFSD